VVKPEIQIQLRTQTETPLIDTLLASDLIPREGSRHDESPPPEDYLVRRDVNNQSGLIGLID